MQPFEAVVWVTGGRGFIGRHVARGFSSRGCTVAGIGRGAWSAHREWGISTWLEAPVLADTLRTLMLRTGPPDIVFHAAGTGTVTASTLQHRRSFEDTVGSAFELIEFVRESAPDCAIVYVSSCAVYGQRSRQPLSEDLPSTPVSVYGTHKSIAEALCTSAARDFGITCAIIRYFSVYGPELRKQLMWEVASRAARKEDVVRLGGTGTETRDVLHIEDAVRLAIIVAEKCINTDGGSITVNGGTGEETSVARMVEILLKQLPQKPAVEFTGERRRGDPPHYAASIERLNRVGFVPRWTADEGLVDYSKWLAATLWG